MAPRSGRAAELWRRWGIPLFWVVFAVWAGVTVVRNAKRVLERERQLGAALLDTGTDPQVDDFEGMWRAALRMSRHEVAFYPHTKARTEMPSKHGPFLETLLLPTVPMGPAWAAILFQCVSMVLLAATLVLGQRLATRVLGRGPPEAGAGAEGEPAARPLSPWTTPVAFALLIPFVQLAAKYNQSVFLMVFLAVWGLVLLPRRPLAAGALLALPGAIKLLPLVLGPWLLWKRQLRAFAGWCLALLLTFVPLFVHQGWDLGWRQLDAYQHMIRADAAFDEYHERFQGLPSLLNATMVEHYAPDMDSEAQDVGWDGVRNFLPFLSAMRRGIVVAACLALVLTCMLCVRHPRVEHPRRYLAELGLVLLAMLLLSPHTWKHYLWWEFPAVLLACAEWQDPRRRPWARAFLVVVLLTQTLPHRGLLGFAPILWQSWQVFHGIALGGAVAFVFLARRLWRDRATPEG
ncbi:MAG: glycosyltransferase family 87 protein [Planctomycetota bacterium]